MQVNPSFFLIITIPIYISYMLGIGIAMFKKRKKAVLKKEISINYFKDYQEKVPVNLQVIKNHFENQFQIPIVYFVTVLALIQFQAVDIFSVLLGYAFLISRVLHSYIHLGKNNVLMRAKAYFVGILLILIMWSQLIYLNLFN